jgi:hypothetical protein
MIFTMGEELPIEQISSMTKMEIIMQKSNLLSEDDMKSIIRVVALQEDYKQIMTENEECECTFINLGKLNDPTIDSIYLIVTRRVRSLKEINQKYKGPLKA